MLDLAYRGSRLPVMWVLDANKKSVEDSGDRRGKKRGEGAEGGFLFLVAVGGGGGLWMCFLMTNFPLKKNN